MNSLFFWLSKLAWLAIAPDSLLLILVLLTWALLWRGRVRLAQRMLGLVAIVMLIVALFPVGEWVLQPLEKRFATNPVMPQKIDGIIVLGGAVKAGLSAAWDQVELGDGAERLLAFQALARQYPEARLVFTGGSGKMVNQTHKEADAAKKLFEQSGFDVSRIIFERESRNTFENAVLSKSLVKPVPGQNWILITSAFHMPRSVGIFCQAGWPVIPYPVDHHSLPESILRIDLDLARHLDVLAIGIKEWTGLTAYYASRKTAALLPSGCVGD